jgi:hypothetical protein
MDLHATETFTAAVYKVEEKCAYEKLRDKHVAELATRFTPVQAAADNL